MTLDEVARRFDNARRTGTGYQACCPVHEDDRASLSINKVGDKILIFCHAGCSIDAILRAKNLSMKDLFVTSNGHQSSPVTTYYYRDQHGATRYRKQRHADKRFFFAKADGHGGWVTSAEQNGGKPVMEGVERLLYRLDDLREQSEGSSSDVFRIFIAEGEKDVDNLWTRGLAATTNDDGASEDGRRPKWRDVYTQQLKDAGVTDVALLRDADDAGTAHREAVARSCHAAGLAVYLVELPGTHAKKGYDVSDWFDEGHSAAELVAVTNAAARYVPTAAEPDVVLDEPPLPPPYTFEHAFPPGHFVTTWIEHFHTQCDAALEFHEAAALVALAAATPSLTARISGSARGLRTNLYVLLMGRAGLTRKSTAKDYTYETLQRALPQALLPEQMTQESFVESLALCNGGAALWAIDEFTDTLSKLVTSKYLAGMQGLLLALYALTDYTYRRVSKGAKKHEDHFAIRNVTLSLIACATPTLFQKLDNTAVGSGLLTRFAIVMPESKPPRLPQYALQEDPIPNTLVTWLHDISKSAAERAVTFAPGVLEQLDEAIDKPLDESADRCQMTVRMGVMARKVAMLSAAGRVPEFELDNTPLVVTQTDAAAAIRVVGRWITYAQAFEARTEESSFEVKVQKCLDIIKGRTLNRREVARRVHIPAKEMLEIEKTLEQRDHIEVIVKKPATGRSSVEWRWVG